MVYLSVTVGVDPTDVVAVGFVIVMVIWIQKRRQKLRNTTETVMPDEEMSHA